MSYCISELLRPQETWTDNSLWVIHHSRHARKYVIVKMPENIDVL
jgi:hypothetical protein